MCSHPDARMAVPQPARRAAGQASPVLVSRLLPGGCAPVQRAAPPTAAACREDTMRRRASKSASPSKNTS